MSEEEINKITVVKCAELFCINNSRFKFICNLCTNVSEDNEWWDVKEYFNHLRALHTRTKRLDTDTDAESVLFEIEEGSVESNISEGFSDDNNMIIEKIQIEPLSRESFSREQKNFSENDIISVIENDNEDCVQDSREELSTNFSIDSESEVENEESQTEELESQESDPNYVSDYSNSNLSKTNKNRNLSGIKDYRKNGPYSCNICKQSFKFRHKLNYHMSTHLKNRFQCSQCEKSYCYEQNLTRHMNSHVIGKPFICQYCGKSFLAKDTLKNHETIHTGESKKHKCTECERSFFSPGLLNVHIRKAHTGEKPFKCNFCGAGFVSKHELTYCHEPCLKSPFTCKVCNDRFNSQEDLNNHVNCNGEGVNNFKCKICSAQLKSRKAFDCHKKVHLIEISTCNQCGKEFKNKTLLGFHTKIHEHPYDCSICNKLFPSEKSRDRHVEYYHRRERPFKCGLCNATFLTPVGLRKHDTIHSGKKPYKCDDCDKAFPNYEGLYSHRRVHADRKTCENCGKSLAVLYMKSHKCVKK